jgi:DNA-binding NarL/FixJ family response regulator
VVLLDFDLGGEHVSQFVAAARAGGFEGKILMVTAGMNATESSMALTHGASGIFLKHSSPGNLAQAIRLVAAGQMWVDQKVVQMLAEGVPQREDTLRNLLTVREQQVLQSLFEGLTNKEIAAQLGVSESAVKATLQQLFQKTRVRTRSQLVRIALESSLSATRKL